MSFQALARIKYGVMQFSSRKFRIVLTNVSVVIPAYDEIENLRIILPKLNRQLDAVGQLKFEILVIVRVAASEAQVTEIRSMGGVPVRRSPGDLFGDAIRTGLRTLDRESDYVLVMDADGSHSPETVPSLISEILDKKADVVIASRYTKGGSSDNSLLLRAMSRTLNATYALVLGIRCRDISTNFKIYRSNLVRDLNLSCNNYDIVEEILLNVRRRAGQNFTIIEIPDRFNKRIHGESKRNLGLFIATYIITLVRLRFRKLR